MRNHNFNFLFWSLIFMVLFIPSSKPQSNSDTEKKIKNAGLLELPRFLNNIPAGLEKQFGFENRAQFNKITAGRPLRHYALSDESSGNNKEISIVPGNEWFLPLMVNNKYVALLTVSGEGDKFSAVDFGAGDLAAELNFYKTEIENQNNNPGNLRVYKIQGDILMIATKEKPDKVNLVYPLKSSQAAFNLDSVRGKHITFPELQTLIREKLDQITDQNSKQ